MSGGHRLSVGFFKAAGRKGGLASAKKLTKRQRSMKARKAVTARWKRRASAK